MSQIITIAINATEIMSSVIVKAWRWRMMFLLDRCVVFGCREYEGLQLTVGVVCPGDLDVDILGLVRDDVCDAPLDVVGLFHKHTGGGLHRIAGIAYRGGRDPAGCGIERGPRHSVELLKLASSRRCGFGRVTALLSAADRTDLHARECKESYRQDRGGDHDFDQRKAAGFTTSARKSRG